jgi:glycosyltransferase involved in cell wall biosynthesis
MNTATGPATPGQSTAPAHRLSVVIPMYNEVDNCAPLLERMHAALASYPHPWELILVDDNSTDGTVEALSFLSAEYGPHVRVIPLVRNYKQTAAMQAGLDAARGDVIVTMDGDLQNDPEDIPRMVARLLNEHLDLVAGWRKDRKDNWLLRRLPSQLANRLIARATGVRLHDYGCSLKAFRASTIKRVKLYGEMHRFIPAWLTTVTRPGRIAEEVVNHHPRILGQSKYGLSRTFRVVLDLVSVYFFMRYRSRPGHFFGGIGIALGLIGGAILSYLMALKLIYAESIGTRPLFFLGFFLVIAALQMVTTGVLAEIVARVYFESGASQLYLAHDEDNLPDEQAGWHQPNP